MSRYYQKMMESLEKLREIKGNSTKVVAEVKRMFEDEVRKVKLDVNLSDTGKINQIQQLRKKYGAELMKIAKMMRDEYDKAVVSARVAAEMLLSETPKPPAESAVKTFERAYKQLKTELLLETNPETALKKITDFVEKQSEPYFASVVLDEFPALVGHVLDAAGKEKDKYKIKLRDVLGLVQRKALSDEQHEALKVQEQLADQFGARIFGNLEVNTVESTFGREFAQYVNKPQYFNLDSEGAQQ